MTKRLAFLLASVEIQITKATNVLMSRYMKRWHVIELFIRLPGRTL